MFRIKNGFKQRDEVSRLLCNLDLECSIWKVPENQAGLKLNVTHHLLVHAEWC